MDSLLVCLIILTVCFLALAIFSVIQQNAELFNIKPNRFLTLKILDTTTASSLFVTLLGALVVRHQFVLGFRPRIGYTSEKNISLKATSKCETWQVKIRNVGLGPAIISRTEFNLEISEPFKKLSSLSFDNLVQTLAKEGLVNGTDYWLQNITTGFTLSPQDEYLLFEIKVECLAKLKSLETFLIFHGFLRDKYFRKVFLLPTNF